ncbi:sodium:proton antiporter [Hydromonas duriensis]|uniref:UIT6 family transporter n=1 Tax=Hydromonas duriensis TaxID=1527608 RepID=A0A4R6YAI6_9BURK|nr:sodium:proton antiporter [Hydromonas duriensis]TDR32590.1 UIT6 family transporter [Hydromonas duriensis]
MLKNLFILLISLFSHSAFAAEGGGLSSLGLIWALPFAGVLLSIAIFPLVAPHFWHQHFGKVAAAWAAAFLIPAAVQLGIGEVLHITAHAVLAEYIPFIALIASLYIISGGIYIKGNLHGSPKVNTAFLAIGAGLASLMGTTGAAMLLIRPLLRANDNRKHKIHVVVFFIFLVANIGGSLTPLGDPPLFLGFLKGVPFLWTLQNILPETLLSVALLLVVFYLIDLYYYHNREEDMPAIMDPTPDTRDIGFEGGLNFVWLLGAVLFVLLSGLWQSDVVFHVLGTPLPLPSLVRDVGLVLMAGLSWRFTAQDVRLLNHFNFEPVFEVAKLFIAIFLTIAPVIAMLQAGSQGPFASLVSAVHDANGVPIDGRYFWATGLLSGFLDNAPTYLVFFNLAGGDVAHLTTSYASTLAAISAGSVFMGALSYIGNAPNFMVKAIAEHSGLKMPSFFGYLAWSFGILIPLFLVLTVIFFRAG